MEKQKSVKLNQDPVIETTEMKARAKVLEQHLQKLWKRKVPRPRKTATTTAEKVEATVKEDVKEPEEESIPRTDEQQVPLQAPEEIRDEL